MHRGPLQHDVIVSVSLAPPSAGVNTRSTARGIRTRGSQRERATIIDECVPVDVWLPFVGGSRYDCPQLAAMLQANRFSSRSTGTSFLFPRALVELVPRASITEIVILDFMPPFKRLSTRITHGTTTRAHTEPIASMRTSGATCLQLATRSRCKKTKRKTIKKHDKIVGRGYIYIYIYIYSA